MNSPRQKIRTRCRYTFLLAFIFYTIGIDAPALAQKKNFTLEDVSMSGKFFGKSIRGFKWMKSGDSYAYLETPKDAKHANVYVYNCATDKSELLLDLSQVKEPGSNDPISMMDYTFSPDESVILFTLKMKAIWRHSRTAQYFVYDMKAASLRNISKSESDVMNAKFSPDGKKVGFVRGGNIFVYDIATDTGTQLTHDASEHVFNGKFGWVYEEEFSISDGWRWSPDSKHIAFWQEDETQVPEYTLTDWMPLHLALTKIRYPKPGDKNPVMKIGVVSIDTKEIKWMDVGSETDVYIPRIQWTADPSALSIQRLNRLQNHLELLFADITTGATRTVLEEKSNAWIDIEDYLTFLSDKKHFIWASERDGWKHLYQYDYTGKLIGQITKGEWEVDGLTFVDEKNRTIFFLSTEVSPNERHLFSSTFDGSKKTRLTTIAASHAPDMSPTGAYYTDRYSSVAAPSQFVLYDRSGKEIRKLVENKGEMYADYKMSARALITFQTSDGATLYASMIQPPDFDASKKYPALFDVYGGPGSQSVRNSWTSLWHQLLAQKGYIIFQMDSRGTGARGTAFKHLGYKNLGEWEVKDYIEGAKYLATLSYVDASRIGIWGWSYGGYMAALTMLRAGDYFKAGIAVAPVTDWKFYDTIYTERYMQTPELNPDGYKKSSCMTYAKELKGQLLLVHGGVDDNVHLQNTIHLVDALEKANKQFDFRIYPNGNHGIGGGIIRMNLYAMILNFLEKNL